MDFAIALLLFTFTLAVYFGYANNFQKQEKGELDALITDAKSISSSLALPGYPNNWNNETVIRMGIAEEHRINSTKVSNFKLMNYNASKRIFGTIYEYFVFFTNDKGEVLNVNGVCGIGNPIVGTKYNVRSAYYYQDEDDEFLKDFMNETFAADIYKNDMDNLMSNLSKYRLLVMEHPKISPPVYNDYKDAIESYASNGSLSYFMISGQLVDAQDRELVGVDFIKKSGESPSECPAIVNSTDQYLSLTVGQSLVFDQCYRVENSTSATPPTTDFKIISTFNKTDEKAIARWGYGNGTVYFFSDFKVTFFSGDFVKIVEDAAKSLISGTCTPINATNAARQKLVKTERYLIYNSKPVKMVVYLWQ